ncbi:hypothetical protein XFPR_07105 [Xylella fastidiosa]|uniref:hypothetical protein n=1 Tax=Xylella fastidiosa TaxID=2371 RepID=UPI0003D2EB57|nr:hypothetical protein [Xylella fastidiosa]ALQ94278.1 hypothetical protein XFUD_02930 [Xylella fastidiosa]ALR04358.1 hypothetical protein XFPR_06815 [Xylella fastidiosa]ALR04410.1 hypothetical protein XFPR_07105 [Xylella fastidiosa]KXB18675.1 hypothetical protein ADT30_10465 [Xylella fastidiosa]OJZ70715.1 hypothetical protein B375_0206705 [Xylella fastidiosa 6c]
MDKFNRNRQRRLLELAREVYPWPAAINAINTPEFDMNIIRAEVHYLAGHGLIECEGTSINESDDWAFMITLTPRGIDFLAEDGGLSAILGVVNVRLTQDTVRDLLLQRIVDCDADNTVKGKVIEQIKSLPASGIQKIAEKVLEASLRNLPDAIRWLQTVIPTL